MPWVAALLPVVTGVIQMVSSHNKQKKLEGQMDAYQTPREMDKIVQFNQSAAQGGFSPEALSFLTKSIEGATSNSLNAVTRAGGTPNDVSAILANELNAYMKLGGEDSLKQFNQFDKYINSLAGVIQAKDAEWADKRNLLKDQLQQAAVDKNQGFQNIAGGLNSGIQSWSNMQANNMQMDLYKMDNAARDAQWQQLMASLSGSSGSPTSMSSTPFLSID